MSEENKRKVGNLTVNRRATHDYFVLEKVEAGIELVAPR
jgi:tmRNA-binding protein